MSRNTGVIYASSHADVSSISANSGTKLFQGENEALPERSPPKSFTSSCMEELSSPLREIHSDPNLFTPLSPSLPSDVATWKIQQK